MSSCSALSFTLQVLSVFVVLLQSSGANFPPFVCPPPPPPPQPTTFVVYSASITAQNGTVPPNANRVPVAGIQGAPYNLMQFGTVYVIDNNLTATTNATLTIGQVMGTIIVASLDGYYLQLSVTFYFNNGQYANSTLVALGVADKRLTNLTVPIVGGTNNFLYATGKVIAQIISTQGSFTLEKVTFIYENRPRDCGAAIR